MSSVRKPNPVVALAVGDLHLCHHRPSARADEDWYWVMENYLRQLDSLQKELDVPILCAGDIFDKWNSPPELINFAIDYLPFMYTIPGQHDLPYHGYDRMESSAYWTLVQAGVINDLYVDEPRYFDQSEYSLCIHGIPWGMEPKKADIKDEALHIALVHAFIWKKDKGYPGAPEDSLVSRWKKKLQGYDVAIFGDNHQAFTVGSSPPTIHNCGTFIRRHQNEIDERPSVGLIHLDGSITREYFDTSIDIFADRREEWQGTSTDGLDDFLESLDELDLESIDFPSQLRKAVEEPGVRKEVRDLLLKVLDGICE